MQRYQPPLPDDTLRKSGCYPGPAVQRPADKDCANLGRKKKDSTYARYQEKYIQNKNILILIMGTKA